MSLVKSDCENTVFYMDVAKLVFYGSSAPMILDVVGFVTSESAPAHRNVKNQRMLFGFWWDVLIGRLSVFYDRPYPGEET